MIEVVRPHSGRSRIRQRAALPQSADVAEHAAVRHHAKRRNDRHAGRAARNETQGPPDAGDLQRRRQHDRPRGRRRHLPARRPGNRRRVDQGVHVAMRRDGAARPVLRPHAPPQLRGRPADHRRADRAAAARRGSARHEQRSPPHRGQVRLVQQLPVPGPAVQLSRRLWKAPSSSRKSATSTPKATRPPR